jgi:uncharacterized protein (TIGR00369 family)
MKGIMVMRLNPLHIQELIKLINDSPFFQLLSMAIEDIGIGYSIIRINMDNKHLSPYGAIQGGVYAALLDAAAYWAPYAELEEDVGLISIDVNVNNAASVKNGFLMARGERIKAGRTICQSQATITDGNGNVLAHGTSKLLVTKGLQTIPQMIGYSNYNIGPKFI